MTLEESILAAVHELPSEKRVDVLRFAESLKGGNGSALPPGTLKGILARPGLGITEQDIAEVRHDLWGGFPREL